MSSDIKAIGFDVNGVLLQLSGVNLEVLHLANDLQASGFKTGILSNALESEIQIMQELLVSVHDFTYCYYSSREVASKPDARAYRSFAQKVGVLTHELLVIDDQIHNIRGAIESGASTVLFTDVQSLKTELQEYGLLEL